jgi:hypothetical protein
VLYVDRKNVKVASKIELPVLFIPIIIPISPNSKSHCGVRPQSAATTAELRQNLLKSYSLNLPRNSKQRSLR